MQVTNYLDRIKAVKQNEPNLEYLSHLQKQHVINVPFENLDILNRKPLSLEEDELYKKIVHAQRGGVCYELNGLFYYLLKELGFNPSFMAASVFLSGRWTFDSSHLLIIVPIENKEYVVDVGFGGNCPRIPVPTTGEEVEDSDGHYRVKKDETEPFVYLQKKTHDTWDTLFRYRPTEKWDLEKILPSCILTETSPESIFNKMYFLSKVTEDGRVTLLGDSLIIVKGKDITKEKLDDEDVTRVANQEFHEIFGC